MPCFQALFTRTLRVFVRPLIWHSQTTYTHTHTHTECVHTWLSSSGPRLASDSSRQIASTQFETMAMTASKLYAHTLTSLYTQNHLRSGAHSNGRCKYCIMYLLYSSAELASRSWLLAVLLLPLFCRLDFLVCKFMCLTKIM